MIFKHRLALALGKSRHEIEQLPAGELRDWYRYANTEPFGFHNDERRFAILAANSLTASSNKFRNNEVYSPNFWSWKLPKTVSMKQSLEIMQSQFPMTSKRKRKLIN